MLFTQSFELPSSGKLRVGTIGGQPFEDREGQQMQVGYILPPRLGLVHIDVEGTDERIYRATAEIQGYGGHLISDVKCPARVAVELPCSVKLDGPPGLNVIVMAWEVYGFSDRGASKSFTKIGAPLAGNIPTWASCFDFSGVGATAQVEFQTNVGLTVGFVTSTQTNFSIPNQAAKFLLSGDDGSFLVFRQQG